MSRLGLFVAALLVALAPRAQTADSLGTVHDLADVQPEVVGGMSALVRSVVYPPSALARDIEGRVIAQFVVTAQGAIADPVVLRSPDDALSQAALAALLQQRFTPGQVDGQPVAVRMTLPITFRIPDDAPPPSQLMARPLAEIPKPDADGVYEVATVQPELIGGPRSIRPDYPVDARRGGIQGRVIVQFVVDEEGYPTDLEVVRSPHELLTRAAVDEVRRLRFEPGQIDGRPVKVRFSLPITFRLR